MGIEVHTEICDFGDVSGCMVLFAKKAWEMLVVGLGQHASFLVIVCQGRHGFGSHTWYGRARPGKFVVK